MFRLKTLATRIFILALIGAGCWIGRNGIVRAALIYTSQAKTGAKVEIGEVFTSFDDGKVFIKQLAVADPRSPMKNLFQAESAVLKLDLAALAKRQFVVESGATSQLVFGSPRTISGSLTEHSSIDDAPLSIDQTRKAAFSLTHPDPREKWLDQFKFSSNPIAGRTLEINKTADRIFADLEADLDRHSVKLADLEQLVGKVQSLMKEYDDNGLRPEPMIDAKEKIENIGDEIKSTISALTELDRQIADHQTELLEAKKRDEAALLSARPQQMVDGETLAALLLNKEQLQTAENVLQWYLSFRDSIPDPQRDFPVAEIQATMLPQSADRLPPSFWIKSLNLDGEGRFAGQKFNFSGELKDLSLQPERIGRPATCQLRAQGNTHFVINCVVDRTADVKRDRIEMLSSNLHLPPRTLGEDYEDILSLSVSPCRSKMDIVLECVDEQLSGHYTLEFENLAPRIEHLDQRAGGEAVADQVNLKLASIGSYQVNATIGGTLSDPVVTFNSDLGDKLAERFNQVLNDNNSIAKRELDKRHQQLRQQLSSVFAERLRLATESSENLKREVMRKRDTVVAELNGFQNKLR